MVHRDERSLPIMVIQLQAVNRTYQTPAGAFAALRDVDLAIDAGEFVAIVGK